MLEGRDWEITQGDTLNLLRSMPDQVIQVVPTSPPYFGLRDYNLPPTAWPEVTYTPMPGLQPITIPAMTCCLGLELTPEAYTAHLVLVFRELWRVLRDDGTIWLNIGDSYAGGGNNQGNNSPLSAKQSSNHGAVGQCADHAKNISLPAGLKPKDLMMMPARVAFALQADGWYLRSDIIWAKPNPMPESVTDRPTKAHEYLFLLSKNQKYYYDAEAIREPHSDPDRQGGKNTGWCARHAEDTERIAPYKKSHILEYNPAGRNRHTVWTIATHPFSEAHFATFPPALVEPCILAGSSPQACPVCGAPWRRVVEKQTAYEGHSAQAGRSRDEINASGKWAGHQDGNKDLKMGPVSISTTVGWSPTCSHDNDGSGKSIVLDPFSGSGTTVMVALRHGRKGLGLELNPAYVKMSKRRIINDNPLFNGTEMRG